MIEFPEIINDGYYVLHLGYTNKYVFRVTNSGQVFICNAMVKSEFTKWKTLEGFKKYLTNTSARWSVNPLHNSKVHHVGVGAGFGAIVVEA